MTSQMNTKVRLVKCPTCQQVLPELADIPVYKCGGCGTVLQAKKQRDTHDTRLLVHEADLTQQNGLDHLMNPSTDESDLEKILERCGSGIECRKEGIGGFNQSHEYRSSDVISCEDTGSAPETNGDVGAEEDEFPLVQYGNEYHNELEDDNSDLPGDISAANKKLASPELNLNEDKSLVQGPGSPREEDESRRFSGSISCGPYGGQTCMKGLPTSTSFSGDLSSSYESCEDGNLSSGTGTDREVDDSLKYHSISRSPAAVYFVVANPEDQIRKAQSLSIEIDLPDNQMFPLSEPTKQAQEGTLPAFQHVSSANTMENIPRVYARTDLGVTLRSSTAKHYYDCGVNTSTEETEYELPNRQFRPSRRNFKDAESSSTNEIPERDELVVNIGMSTENKLPPRPINSSATLSAKKYHTTKGSQWGRGEFQEYTGRSHPVSSKIAAETGEYWSRPPIYSKDSQLVRNGNSTSYEQKGLPERTVDPESDKKQLMRMVYELKDQLNRAHLSKEFPHDRFSSRVAKKEQLSAYQNLFAPNEERYPDLRYPFNPGRQDQVETLFQQGKVPRMAFSGDATHFRHEVDCSCLRCYRQKWHYSAQLPRHAYYDDGHTLVYPRGPRHISHSPYLSASASPYKYKSSEFSRSHDTMSDGTRQNNNEVKKKKQPAKQCVRPIAGGAPIIACYCCNEILQLPVDFLLFKRKCHRLSCSACTAVLKFSLVKQIHIVEYNPEPRTPPPSEVGGYTETTNLGTASGAIDYQHGDPVSSSNGYAKSFHRSSTDIEHFSLAPPSPPSETLNEISVCQKMSAGTPFETKKDGKKTIRQDFRNNYKSGRETFEHGGHLYKVYETENVCSEIEEVPPEDGSPLHQLMGYPSPSRIYNI